MRSGRSLTAVDWHSGQRIPGHPLAEGPSVAITADDHQQLAHRLTEPSVYAQRDALQIGETLSAGISLAQLDVQVITAPSLRLDLEGDRARLAETVARLKPRLLILDPVGRLHRIDENVSGDVAPLLAFLRELQRRHAIAVAVIHHAKKGAGAIRAGQALRGSSEFHACGDSNLYLRRDSDDRMA